MGIKMMIFDLTTISMLLLCHFVGDFIFQTDEQAKGKSSDNVVLFQHVLTYILPFAIVGFLIPISFGFLLFNFIAHFATDYVSSRQTKKLWAKGDTHNFFVVIGADQLVHTLTLIWSYNYLVW